MFLDVIFLIESLKRFSIFYSYASGMHDSNSINKLIMHSVTGDLISIL